MQLNRLASKPQWSYYLSLPNAGITDTIYETFLPMHLLGIQIHVFMLSGQTLYWMSHLLIPYFFKLHKYPLSVSSYEAFEFCCTFSTLPYLFVLIVLFMILLVYTTTQNFLENMEIVLLFFFTKVVSYYSLNLHFFHIRCKLSSGLPCI